jgi:hypothetical protein
VGKGENGVLLMVKQHERNRINKMGEHQGEEALHLASRATVLYKNTRFFSFIVCLPRPTARGG